MNTHARNAAIRLDGVGHRFPGQHTHVLADVSLTVDVGELVALIGPSGAGKTTLLSLLDGRLRGWDGSARVNGVALSSRNAPRSFERVRTGFIFQDFALVERRSVRQNVLNGRLGRTSVRRSMLGRFSAEDELAVESAIADVGLVEMADRRVDALSGGQRQRVAIARCLAQEPELILADEPINNLDPQSSRDILSMLARVARARATTLIFSSHQPDLALSFATRVLGLKNGALVLDAPVCDVTDAALGGVYEDGDFPPSTNLRLVG